MKICIEKRYDYDNLGDEFLKEVVAEIYGHDGQIIIKIDSTLYAIPKSVIKVVMEEQ